MPNAQKLKNKTKKTDPINVSDCFFWVVFVNQMPDVVPNAWHNNL